MRRFSPSEHCHEAKWSRVLPEGITLHVTRMRLHPLGRDLVAGASLLAQAGVMAIAYGCMAGSMIEPLDGLSALIARTTGIQKRSTYIRCAMILPLRL